MENQEKVLEVKDLVISFKTDRGIVHAVRGVSFDLYKGETLCIVGESGSGKSVTNKAIMGISANNAIIENGSILFEGEDLTRVSEEEFHRIRGHKIGMIFQDPLSALNPVMKVGKQIIEATMINRNILKRRYNDLISNELVAYRNNKANVQFNISKIKNEVEQNEDFIKKIKQFNKDKEKLEKHIERLTKFNNPKFESKINELKDSLTELNDNFNELLSNIKDYAFSLSKSESRNIEKYQSRIEKYSKINTFENDLKKEINENTLKAAKSHLEYFSNPEFYKFDEENIIDSLKKHNEILLSHIKIYKEEYKTAKKPLKIDLKISKAKAKKDVKEYKEKITLEHHNKIKELLDKLNNLELNKENYLNTLSSEEKEKLLKDIKYNRQLLAKQEKEKSKLRDVNVSKTTKTAYEFKAITDKKYLDFEKDIKEIKDEILKEKERFISLTKITKAEAKKMALTVMKEVGIPLPERRFYQYPFEFSGGMRQRIVIAIALTANPDILICDEPTTALDVTIQAQILELINRLKKERHLSCIFITHDLGVVANMADRVAVMYAGKIVEYGLANEVFFDPRHPYTWALLSSIPDIDSKEELEAIPGTPPDMINPPKGDAFALRSKYAMAIDFKYEPPFFKVSDTHYAATWLLYPGAPKVEMPQIVKTRIKNALEEERLKNEKVEVI